MDSKIIEALKNNLAKPEYMDGDIRRAMESIEKKEFIFLLPDGTWGAANPLQGFEKEIYRLRPDYAPDPEIIECEVTWTKSLGYIKDMCLTYWLSHSNFLGFKYDGVDELLPNAVAYMDDNDGVVHFLADFKKIKDGTTKVIKPTHAWFSNAD